MLVSDVTRNVESKLNATLALLKNNVPSGVLIYFFRGGAIEAKYNNA